MATYRTVDLARAAGVHPNTVRLYERIGFISRAPRAANGYRVFGEKHLWQIRVCRCIFDHGYLGRRLRAASLSVIGAAGAWNLPLAHRHAEEYLALVQHELAVARKTADILARWARGARRTRGGRTYSRREMAEQIGVTEEALRNWERNGLLRVPRTGPNRTRVYREAERERLRVIYMLRQSGYSMSAIHNSLRRYDGGDRAGVIEALNEPEAEEGTTWTQVGDHWLEALEGARHGAEQITSLLEQASAEKSQPSIGTPPFAIAVGWSKGHRRRDPCLDLQGQRQREESTMPYNTTLVQVIDRDGGQMLGYLQYANTILIQVIDRPARKLILKRGVKATHYYEYCDEVGCELPGLDVKEALYEPIGMWLPENLQKLGTSVYAIGVEVPADYAGEVAVGYDMIDLPACKMMFFQGPPCEGEPLRDPVRDAMDTYDVTLYGYEWAAEDGPRFQLPPRGDRGYIEARPVRELTVK